MKIGGKKLHLKKIGHKSAHVIHIGSKQGSHLSKVTGKALVLGGKLTGNEEMVLAGKGAKQLGKELDRVAKISGKAEKMTA